jgi:mono/diheme cytochrome c family protein
MNEQNYTYRVQWLVLIGAALLLLLLFGAWIREGLNKEWRTAQKEYARILKEFSTEEDRQVDEFEHGIFQVELAHFGRTDRCISCHHGLENTQMKGMPQPHASHPGTFLEDHPVQEYGCTICHGGQPGALTKKEAFGRLPETHWPFPLLEQPYIQSSCGKCHLAVFSDETKESKDNEAPGAREGMEVFLSGKSIFSAEGCLGCHQARGVGGILGPDLTEQGEKTKHEYSFQNISGEQSVSNWLKEHFRDPEMVSPGSEMLKISLEESELEALATFVMGLEKPEIPFDYFSMATLNEFKGKREFMEGDKGYSYLCSACHGKTGEGKSYENFKTGIPAIGNPDFLRVASREYIRFTLEKGRSLRQMGSWSTRISGMQSEELDQITSFLKGSIRRADSWKLSLQGADAGEGLLLFERYCQTCHGKDGKGGVAVALNQEGLLSRAGNDFLIRTLLNGRGNTAMPGWSHLEDDQLADLVAVLSSWREGPPITASLELPEADLEQGALSYHFLCSRCHGEFGEGETGPAIINKDFLEAAKDRFLYETIARGRAHTAMFGWSSDVYNQEKLEPGDISDIIAFMRESSKRELSYVYQGSNPGDSEAGRLVFDQRCAECHGKSGEGLKAPALNNQEFLSAASNGFLLATITLGRAGTAMPSWGYGMEQYPMLSGKERIDLVAFLRSNQRIRIKY